MNPIIEHIITLIKGAKADNRIRYTDPNSGMIYTLGSSRYLLGQTVRQYWIPNDHIFISEAAKETWNRITSQSIRGCSYQATVVFEKDESLTVYEYTGASKTPMVKQLKKGDFFHYRQVFHDEHVVGVEDILDALCELPDDKLNEQNVIGILDHIYICKILKKEDRELQRSGRNTLDVDEAINKFYVPKGIVVDRDYIKNLASDFDWNRKY